jgi:hypothetical protein
MLQRLRLRDLLLLRSSRSCHVRVAASSASVLQCVLRVCGLVARALARKRQRLQRIRQRACY